MTRLGLRLAKEATALAIDLDLIGGISNLDPLFFQGLFIDLLYCRDDHVLHLAAEFVFDVASIDNRLQMYYSIAREIAYALLKTFVGCEAPGSLYESPAHYSRTLHRLHAV